MCHSGCWASRAFSLYVIARIFLIRAQVALDSCHTWIWTMKFWADRSLLMYSSSSSRSSDPAARIGGTNSFSWKENLGQDNRTRTIVEVPRYAWSNCRQTMLDVLRWLKHCACTRTIATSSLYWSAQIKTLLLSALRNPWFGTRWVVSQNCPQN